MRVRCIKCDIEYEDHPGPWEERETASFCPRCGGENILNLPLRAPPFFEGDGYVTCLNCCQEMVPRPDSAIHICEKCSGDEGERKGKIWIVKRGSEGYGPFDLATILRWVKTGRLGGEDEVAVPGGRWTKIATAPEFTSLVTEGMEKEVAVKLPRAGTFPSIEKGGVKRAAAGLLSLAYRAAGIALVLSILTLILALSYHLGRKGYFVIPEKVIERAGTVMKGLYERWRPGGGVEVEDTISPYEEELLALVESLRKENEIEEGDTASYREYYLEGRRLLLLDNEKGYEEGKSLLEKGFILNPHSPFTVAYLLEGYARGLMLEKDLDMGKRAMTLSMWAELNYADVTEALRARGLLSLAMNRPAEALPLLVKALSLNPEDLESKVLLAQTYIALKKDYQEVKGLLLETMEKNPDILSIYPILGSLELGERRFRSAINYLSKRLERGHHGESLYLSGMAMLKAGLPGRAIDFFKRLRGGDRHLAPGLLEKAKIEYQVFRNYREAIKDLNSLGRLIKAGEAGEELEAGWRIHLSAVHRLTGNIRDAVFNAEKASGLKGGEVLSLFHGGIARVRGGDTEKGIEKLREVLNYDIPDMVRSRVYHILGGMNWGRNKLKDALIDLQYAVDEWKFNTEAYLDIATIQAKLGDFQGILSTIDEMRRHDPLYSKRVLKVTDFYSVEGGIRNRIDYMKVAVKERSYIAGAHSSLGAILTLEGLRGEAVRAFGKALSENSADPTSHFFLGIIAYSMGNYGEALTWFNRMIDLEPQTAINYIYAGECLLSTGKVREAKEMFENSLKYDLKLPHAYDGLGVCRALMGEKGDAREDFLKAVSLDPFYEPALVHLYEYGGEE